MAGWHTTRWSKKTDALVRTIAAGVRPGLQSELGGWLEGSARFAEFVAANQDKIRKKLSATDEQARLDVRAELVVAHALLEDRRFGLQFEAYGAGQVGPDFTVVFRVNQQFNVEVTRLRAEAPPDAAAGRLGNIVAAKLRQLRNDRPNVLVISARGLALSEQPVAGAMRLLKSHSDTRDDDFFARRGLKTARDFSAQYVHLSGVFVVDAGSSVFVGNREARRPLASEIVAAMTACLSAAGAAA